MSIFVKVVKKLINLSLEKSMDEASVANNSLFAGPLRNPGLSGKQKKITQALISKIESFQGGTSDEVNLGALKKLILDADTEVEQERTKLTYERGHLNKTLMGINSDLDRFFLTLSKLSYKLVDVTDDADPFHVLCEEAAYYFGENIFFPIEEGLVAKSFTAIAGTSHVSIREKKETCLIKQLTQCDKNLASLKDGFMDQRKHWVLVAAETVQRENSGICKDSQVMVSIPIAFSVWGSPKATTPAGKPSRGRLEKCMQRAIEKINGIDAVEDDTDVVTHSNNNN